MLKTAVALVLLQSATFMSRTELVLVPVTVTDAGGRTVGGLAASHFRLSDAGRTQRIELFQRDDAPVTIGLVIDHSLSMRPKQALIVDALSAFVDAGRSDDQLFSLHFNDEIHLARYEGQPFTSDKEQLRGALSASQPVGATALHDAIAAAVNQLQAARYQKRALIVISDGGDNASQRSTADVIAAARRSDAVIYTIGFQGVARDKRAERVLERLAEQTGGLAYVATSPNEVRSVLMRINDDLRAQYLLGFSPESGSQGPGERRLKVTVSAPGKTGLRVRSRESYTR